ncbi:biotin/lipoate--protein ligase family protein [Plastorhodobacter daqingensis]|uniref:Biotin/lipoate--protein ligase family protein n=1 Tax=Plastorhodobacter daqingensis TaxID=1387281 RepID=A0ABW2URR3_9RHOB
MSTAEITRLTLPPPFAQHPHPKGCVLEEAVRRAPLDGAGTFIYRIDPALVSAAVVLEPEEPLATARMAFFVGMAAIADALAAHCAPERAVRFQFPDGLIYDKARLGGGRFVAPPDCGEADVPQWLVFGIELIAGRSHLTDPGHFPESTSLAEEEFDAPAAILESFASYLMLYFDRWAHQGLGAVTERYLGRIDPPMLRGTRMIEEGDLVERSPAGAVRRISLLEGLAACSWRDAQGPRL